MLKIFSIVMWYLYRPDALVALEDEGVKKALGRYVDIVSEKKLAKFLILKTIEVDFNEEEDEEELWKYHDHMIKKFRDELERIDKQNVTIKELDFKEKNLLKLKRFLAYKMLKSCEFCERRCKVDRLKKQKGFCNLDAISRLSSEFIHLGEEGCLVPSHTFFFIGCNFYCVFCQNWTISRQFEKGIAIDGKTIAEIATRRKLQEESRNINLVGGEPTPNLHTIMDMLIALNVNIPIVWNSNMYMSIKTMKLLDGCVDVYLADFKYGNDKCAERLSNVKNYFEIVSRNHLIAKKQAELLIRHLVMPNHLDCCTKPILNWIKKNLGNDVRVNIMEQYRPEFKAYKYKDINRRLTKSEYLEAIRYAKSIGLTNLDL